MRFQIQPAAGLVSAQGVIGGNGQRAIPAAAHSGNFLRGSSWHLGRPTNKQTKSPSRFNTALQSLPLLRS